MKEEYSVLAHVIYSKYVLKSLVGYEKQHDCIVILDAEFLLTFHLLIHSKEVPMP